MGVPCIRYSPEGLINSLFIQSQQRYTKFEYLVILQPPIDSNDPTACFDVSIVEHVVELLFWATENDVRWNGGGVC